MPVVEPQPYSSGKFSPRDSSATSARAAASKAMTAPGRSIRRMSANNASSPLHWYSRTCRPSRSSTSLAASSRSRMPLSPGRLSSSSTVPPAGTPCSAAVPNASPKA